MSESETEATSISSKGWIGKIKEWSYDNWQTILVVIIVLIVGIGAYNYNRQNSSNTNSGPIAAVSNSNQENKQEATTNEENKESETEVKDEKIAAKEDSKVNSDNKTNTESNKSPNKSGEKKETEKTNSNSSERTYTITARPGEGITHLARRALAEYLKETGEKSDLTKEHKVYIEDYMQNRIGKQKIEVGHKETFSESLIKEAISHAKKLSPKSLENLKKYAERIKW